MEIDGAAGDITLMRPAAPAPPRRPEQVELRRAGFFGDHPPRDKEHHLASRKCRRESTPQSDEPDLKIIDVFMCKLRKKLANASGGKNYIETVWGRGYVLRHPTDEEAVAAAAAYDFRSGPTTGRKKFQERRARKGWSNGDD